MAYDPWDETVPADNGQLADGNDAIIAFKEQVRERMNSILAADPNSWDTATGADADNEIQLDLSVVGIRTDVGLFFGPGIFRARSDQHDIEFTDTYLRSDDEADRWLYGDLQLPVGAHIKSVKVILERESSQTPVATLYKRAYNTTPAYTSMGSANLTADGVVEVEPFAGDYTILTNESFSIKLDNDAERLRVYGVQVTLDLPGVETYV